METVPSACGYDDILLASLAGVHWNCEALWVVVGKCEGLKWCEP